MSTPSPFTPPIPITSPIILPLPIGFFNTPGGGSGQFNNNEQQILATLADSLISFNASTIQQGAPDLLTTQQALLGQGTKLSNFAPNFITLNQLLSIANAQQNLTTLLQNPENFVNSLINTGIQDVTSIGLPTIMFKSFGVATIPSSAGINSGPAIRGRTSGLLVANVNQSTTGIGPATLGQTLSSFTFPTQIRPFIDALFGQNPSNPPTNDVFSGLNALYNFFLGNPGGFGNFASVINAFNQGGLLTGSIQTSSIPYYFPVNNGDNITNFLTMLLTWATSPSLVLAELLMTPPANNQATSVPYQIYNFLNNQPAISGFTTAQSGAQTFSRPLVNALFGTNPTTNSTTDPFSSLFSLAVNGPVKFIQSQFSTTAFPGAGNLTPQTLINDFMTNPSQFETDVLAILINSKSGFNTVFTGLFSSSAPWSNAPTNVNQLVGDFFNTPLSIPKDLLNLVPVGTFAGFNTPLSGAIGLGNQIAQFFANLNGMAQTLFVGQHPSSNFLAFNDSVQFGNIPSGTTAGGSASGWGSSVVPSGFALNGQLQGDLGAVIMLGAAAAGDAINAISSVKSSVSNFLNINFVGSTFSAGSALQQLLSSAFFAGQGLQLLGAIVSQLIAAIANINNILSNAGIPTGPLGTGTNFNMNNVINLL